MTALHVSLFVMCSHVHALIVWTDSLCKAQFTVRMVRLKRLIWCGLGDEQAVSSKAEESQVIKTVKPVGKKRRRLKKFFGKAKQKIKGVKEDGLFVMFLLLVCD